MISDFAQNVWLDALLRLQQVDEGVGWYDEMRVLFDSWLDSHQTIFRISWAFPREQEWSYWGTEYESQSGKRWPRSPTLEQCLHLSCEAIRIQVTRHTSIWIESGLPSVSYRRLRGFHIVRTEDDGDGRYTRHLVDLPAFEARDRGSRYLSIA